MRETTSLHLSIVRQCRWEGLYHTDVDRFLFLLFFFLGNKNFASYSSSFFYIIVFRSIHAMCKYVSNEPDSALVQ